MPRVILTERAAQGLARCDRFLAGKSPQAARRAAQTIRRHLTLLETNPGLGRPFAPVPELREMVIAFGESGYVALYRHVLPDDAVYVLAFRHQKEAGF